MLAKVHHALSHQATGRELALKVCGWGDERKLKYLAMNEITYISSDDEPPSKADDSKQYSESELDLFNRCERSQLQTSLMNDNDDDDDDEDEGEEVEICERSNVRGQLQISLSNDDDDDDDDEEEEVEIFLGTPPKISKMTGADFDWVKSKDIPSFPTYAEYLLSVTKGGPASGPEKAKYKLHNKSRKKNIKGEHIHTNFKCASHTNCSHEVRSSYSYLLF